MGMEFQCYMLASVGNTIALTWFKESCNLFTSHLADSACKDQSMEKCCVLKYGLDLELVTFLFWCTRNSWKGVKFQIALTSVLIFGLSTQSPHQEWIDLKQYPDTHIRNK